MQKIAAHKNQLIYISLGIISALFVLKYAEVYFSAGFPAAILYSALFSIAIYLSNRKLVLSSKVFFQISALLIVLSVLVIYITPRFGNIGRLPSIEDWWRLFFIGEFPYNSHLTPSSFPFLFATALPFYFIDQIGWLVVFGLAVVLFSLSKFDNIPTKQLALVLLLISPVFWYDLAVRSELIYNMSLFIGAVFLSERMLRENSSTKILVIIGILFGLVMSTRSIVAVPIACYLFFRFKTRFSNIVIIGLSAALIFALILLPFYFWDSQAFLNNGPFAIQAKLSSIPVWVSASAVIIAIFAGRESLNISESFLYSALISLVVILISYFLKISEFGFTTAFFEDKIDLSYLAFPFPLLLIALRDSTPKQAT